MQYPLKYVYHLLYPKRWIEGFSLFQILFRNFENTL